MKGEGDPASLDIPKSSGCLSRLLDLKTLWGRAYPNVDFGLRQTTIQ